MTSYPFKLFVIFLNSWEIKLELNEEDYFRAQIESVKFLIFLFTYLRNLTKFGILARTGNNRKVCCSCRVVLPARCSIAFLTLSLPLPVVVVVFWVTNQYALLTKRKARMVGQYPTQPSCPSNHDQVDFYFVRRSKWPCLRGQSVKSREGKKGPLCPLG